MIPPLTTRHVHRLRYAERNWGVFEGWVSALLLARPLGSVHEICRRKQHAEQLGRLGHPRKVLSS